MFIFMQLLFFSINFIFPVYLNVKFIIRPNKSDRAINRFNAKNMYIKKIKNSNTWLKYFTIITLKTKIHLER